MNTHLIRATAVAAATFALFCAPAQAFGVTVYTLDATETSGSALVGGVATALITLHLDAGLSLEGATFNLDWDPLVLSFLPLQSSAGGQGPSALLALFDPGSLVVNTLTPGHFGVSGFFLNTLSPPAGDVPMVLAFQGLQAGPHQISYELELTESSFFPLYRAGTIDISISAVPEPATYGLMFAGLVAVGAIARRRGRAA